MTGLADSNPDKEHPGQADWFIREVKRCREIGMPVGCCDEWPECSHVLAWVEKREEAEKP